MLTEVKCLKEMPDYLSGYIYLNGHFEFVIFFDSLLNPKCTKNSLRFDSLCNERGPKVIFVTSCSNATSDSSNNSLRSTFRHFLI